MRSFNYHCTKTEYMFTAKQRQKEQNKITNQVGIEEAKKTRDRVHTHHIKKTTPLI